MTDDAMNHRPDSADDHVSDESREHEPVDPDAVDSDEDLEVDVFPNPMADEIFRALYDDLRAIAHVYFRRERDGHTLEPTAVVHEAYLRFRKRRMKENLGRTDLLAILSRMLRNYLIDYHRRHTSEKRGGKLVRTTLVTDIADSPFHVIDFLALDQALDALEKEPQGERRLRGVLFKYMAGLTFEEIGPILGISASRARDDWSFSRAFLGAHLMD